MSYSEQMTNRNCFIRSNALGRGQIEARSSEHQCTTILAIPNTRWRDRNNVGAVLNHYKINMNDKSSY